jgi:hypothetical protein
MARIVLSLFALTAAGCVSIDGGSVEAAWDLHTPDGRRIAQCSCSCPRIAKVRFSVVPAAGGADLCAGRDACQFACGAGQGGTPFDIPPGDYALSLVPVGEDGQDLVGEIPQAGGGTCSAQSSVAPILRTVRKGQPTQLNGVVIKAECAANCGGSDTTKACSR